MMIRWTPFRELADLQGEMNRIFDNYSRRSGTGAEPAGMWIPAVDVYEDEGQFVLHVELPGLNKDDIELHLENRTLTIRGERKHEKGYKLDGFVQRERLIGRFARSFTLPTTIDQEKIAANFKEGVLEIVLPKADEVKPKMIPVQAG